MKRLLLLTTLCVATFAQAVTKDDLEKSIRDLDVESVKQIVESEQFTTREYYRYLALVEQVVQNRELWITRISLGFFAPPLDGYELPSNGQICLELMGSICLPWFGIFYFMPNASKKVKVAAITSIAAGVLLFWKFLRDDRKRDQVIGQAWSDLYARLNKKYEDAVSIKQLVYTANIVEA